MFASQNFSIASQFSTVPCLIGHRTSLDALSPTASSPMTKSKSRIALAPLRVTFVDVDDAFSATHVDDVLRVDIFFANPIFVYPVPLSITTGGRSMATNARGAR